MRCSSDVRAPPDRPVTARQPTRRPSARPPGADALPRATMAARVYAELRERLVAGMLEPGQKVSLRTIAERLGVSVQPVREAVSRLVADRALVVLPNRAVRV